MGKERTKGRRGKEMSLVKQLAQEVNQFSTVFDNATE